MASSSPVMSPTRGKKARRRKGTGAGAEELQTLQVKGAKSIALRKQFPFQLVASGAAGVEELAENLAVDKVLFGMLQMEIGSGTFARTKDIFITWCPSEHPKPLSRAKAMKSLKKAQECIGQCHSELTLTELDQCSIDYIFNYLENKRVFNADSIDGDSSALREEYTRKMLEARHQNQENEVRITQLQAQARQRIQRRRRQSLGSEADSCMTDFTDFTDFTDDLDAEILAMEDMNMGTSAEEMPPLGQPEQTPVMEAETAPEDPPEMPLDAEPATEEKKEEEDPPKKKKKKRKKKKKDDWSDDRPWTGERVLKCIQAETSPINWALFGASDSEIIPLAWGHGDLNSFRQAMPPDRVAYGLYRIAFGSGRWRRTHRIFVMWTPDSMTKGVPQKVRTKRQTQRMTDVSKQGDMKRILQVSSGVVITAEDHEKITIEEFILRVRATLVVDGDDEFMSEEAFLAALEEEERFFAEQKRQKEEARIAAQLLENPKKKKRKKLNPNDPSDGEDGDDDMADGENAAAEPTFENTDEENSAEPPAPEEVKEAEATETKEPDVPTVAVGQGDEEDVQQRDTEESPRTIARKERKKKAAKRRREQEVQAQVVLETVKLVHHGGEPLVWCLFMPFEKSK